MRRWCLGVAFLAGCYRPVAEAPCIVTCNFNAERACPGEQECLADNLCHPPGGGGCSDPGDASTDGDVVITDGPPVDEPPGSFCIGKGANGTGSGLIRVCRPTPPIATVTLGGLINTETHGACEMHPQGPGLPPACVVWGMAVHVLAANPVRAEGVRPLVLVGINGIFIDGAVDVASHIDSTIAGAGADAPQCPKPLAPAFSGGGGAGGAAGGTGQGAGGIGGSSGGGNQGNPGIPTTPTGVRGGCSGGVGAGPGLMCKPGLGGGAVYMISSTGVTIGTTGAINASGGAARGGSGSGCGGGSGGLIGFDAPAIMRSGRLFANGGGASSGANGTGPVDGNDSAGPPSGGFGGFNSVGGSGGNGAAASTFVGMQGSSVATNLYGGGGGGGAGWIVVYGGATIPQNVEVSPPPNSP